MGSEFSRGGGGSVKPLPCRCSSYDSPDPVGPAYSQSVAVSLGRGPVMKGSAFSHEAVRRMSEGVSEPTITTRPRPTTGPYPNLNQDRQEF